MFEFAEVCLRLVGRVWRRQKHRILLYPLIYLSVGERERERGRKGGRREGGREGEREGGRERERRNQRGREGSEKERKRLGKINIMTTNDNESLSIALHRIIHRYLSVVLQF